MTKIWILVASFYLGDTVEVKIVGAYESEAACLRALIATPEAPHEDRDCVRNRNKRHENDIP